MINFFCPIKLDKFAYLYSKPLGNHTLKIMRKYLKNYFKNLEKSWKYHLILSVRKSGNPELRLSDLVYWTPVWTGDDETMAIGLIPIKALIVHVPTNCMYIVKRYVLM